MEARDGPRGHQPPDEEEEAALKLPSLPWIWILMAQTPPGALKAIVSRLLVVHSYCDGGNAAAEEPERGGRSCCSGSRSSSTCRAMSCTCSALA